MPCECLVCRLPEVAKKRSWLYEEFAFSGPRGVKNKEAALSQADLRV